MFSVFLKHVKWLLLENGSKDKEMEARRQFEKDLQYLNESEDEEELNEIEKHEPIAELTWTCTKHEGKFFNFRFFKNHALIKYRCYHFSDGDKWNHQ